MDILGGIMGATGSAPTKTTTNSSFNNQSTQNQSGTSTTSRNLLPSQQNLLGPYAQMITNLMTPQGAQAYEAPFTQAAMDSTNSQYAGLADTLRQQFMTTNNGQSGKYGTALVQGNLQRLGALQNVQTQGQEQAAALPLNAANLAQQLLGTNFGQTTTGSSTGATTSSGTSNSTQTSQQGNMGLGALGGVASGLMTALMM